MGRIVDLDQLEVDDIPPEVLERALARAEAQRGSKRTAELEANRQRREERAAATPSEGGAHSYRHVTSGAWKRRHRPPNMKVEDREWVPVALRHWRQVHGLTISEAQARIGYSPRSNSWHKWESGFVAPSYRTLLMIVGSTGMGRWQDDPLASLPAEEKLKAEREEHKQRMSARRKRRERRRPR